MLKDSAPGSDCCLSLRMWLTYQCGTQESSPRPIHCSGFAAASSVFVPLTLRVIVTAAFGGRRGRSCPPAHVGRWAHGGGSTEVMLQIGWGATLASPPALVNPGNGSTVTMGKGIECRTWTKRPGLQSGPKETLGFREVTPTTAATYQVSTAGDVYAPSD